MKKEDIKYIVIHCSATRSNMNYTAEQLDFDHVQRGFRSAGYHYYIRKNGLTLALRPHHQAGAHCKGYNHCSIAVCYEGGLAPNSLPKDTRTVEQIVAIRRLLRRLKSYYPTAEIVGHRDLSPDLNGDGIIQQHEWLKQCPCFDAKKEYSSLKN